MSRRWGVVLTMLLVLAAFAGPFVLFVGGERGQAAFGDGETFGVNELAAASVDVSVGETTLLIDASAMAPGDQLIGRLAFNNDGTLPLRYSVGAEPENPASILLSELRWSVWAATPQSTCLPVPAGVLFGGVVLGGPLLGDPAVGQDPGDRLLEPGRAETLCVVVELPLGVPDTIQGSTARIDLTVVGEQATEENA